MLPLELKKIPEGISAWLDDNGDKPVVYFCLGTVVSITPDTAEILVLLFFANLFFKSSVVMSGADESIQRTALPSSLVFTSKPTRYSSTDVASAFQCPARVFRPTSNALLLL